MRVIAQALFFVLVSGIGQVYASATFEGIVNPLYEIKLALPLDGVVSKIFVKEGDHVVKAAKLLKLDDALQSLEVTRRKEVYEDNSELDANKKNIVILKALLDSSQKLFESTASISRDEVTNLEMQYHTLNGRINVADAKKKQELIEYNISREVLARYILLAPIDGVVTSVRIKEGEWAKTGEMMITIVDKSVCVVDFNIEERFVRTLKTGRTVSLRVREGDTMTLKKGKIVFVSSVADRASALVKVKVEFENKNGTVIPGVIAQILF
ncbi:MAG: efflux RND transporter periplasmic adaptor subunit [Deltaproteobacteria bacterium]|jgi:RND family efflux transporter MFP subunit|nr:efflux RND transporter periplasmic adaptor subunit [Deltaproteobacteria bacterium]